MLEMLDTAPDIYYIYYNKEPKFWGVNVLKPTAVSNQRREPDW